MKLLAVEYGSGYHVARVAELAVGLGVKVPAGPQGRGDWEGYLVEDQVVPSIEAPTRWKPIPRGRWEVREVDGLPLEERARLIGAPAYRIVRGAVELSSCPTRAGEVLGSRGERVKALSRWLGVPVRYREGIPLWADPEVPDGDLRPYEGRNLRGGTRRGFLVAPAMLARVPEDASGEMRGQVFGPRRATWVAPWVDLGALRGREG